MSESLLTLIFLGVISLCVIVMALAILWVALEVHTTFRRINAMLPGATLTLREVHHALQQGRRLLTQANQMTRQVDMVIHQVCRVASSAVERLAGLQGRFESVWSKWIAHGAGAEPRQHHRSR